MNYNESMEYMEAIKKYGSVLGLDTIKTLLAKMGNPQDELKVIMWQEPMERVNLGIFAKHFNGVRIQNRKIFLTGSF